MELVIMAAGMGSRFGGLKQLEPIDDDGNFIIDYSIFDAIRCGFDKVVFIIKEENYEAFRESIGKRVENRIKTAYVFQNNSNIPPEYHIPENRLKPFGTGHAVLCAKDEINSNFAVINADDFYGYDAFKAASKFLKNNKSENTYALIGYKASNTFCSAKSVKRGVCYTQNGKLTSIIESSLEKNGEDEIIATPIDGSNVPAFKIDNNQTVSMNLFAFNSKFTDFLEGYFYKFLDKNKDDLSTCEYFLPSVVTTLIAENKVSVDVINTDAVWFGMTYKEDKELVKSKINGEKEKGVYPVNLWHK